MKICLLFLLPVVHFSYKKSSGRNRLAFLNAANLWKEDTGCAKPAECTCHCDCPDAEEIDPPAQPPPCPIFPTYTIIPPDASTMLSEDGSTDVKDTCADGEVQRADGSCQKIDGEVIKELKAMVVSARQALDVAQGEYKLEKKECCNKAQAAEKRDQLLVSHQTYKRALDMLLAGLARWKAAEKASEPLQKGPEFTGTDDFVNVGNIHCETWMSKNATFVPTKSLCAVMCRNEPDCAGFTMEKEKRFCVLFDKFSTPGLKPDGATCLSTSEERKYVKNWDQEMLNANITASMAMIDELQEELETKILAADDQSGAAGVAFSAWGERYDAAIADGERTEDEAAANKEFVNDLIKEKDYYGQQLRAQNKIYFAIKDKAAELIPEIIKERHEKPPFPPVVVTPPLRKVPWEDNPNSKDTRWSQNHPECPQGPPCYCDCGCRPSPPQNFVRDMVKAFTPCPLPPPPPPPGSVVKWDPMPPPPVLSR